MFWPYTHFISLGFFILCYILVVVFEIVPSFSFRGLFLASMILTDDFFKTYEFLAAPRFFTSRIFSLTEPASLKLG